MKSISILMILFLPLSVHNTVLADSCSFSSVGKAVHGEEQLLKGHFTSSFENSSFTPCSGEKDIAWWLDAPNHYATLTAELKKLGGNKYEQPMKRLFIKAKACVSRPGSFGHMGAYPRLIEIIELLEFKPESTDDCRDKN